MYIGQLRAAGLAKESVVGTLVTPPTEYLPYIAPDSFFPSIKLLESNSIRQLADRVYLASQGPGEIKGLKLKWQASAGNIGNLLMSIFGTDTLAESASFVITAGVNDKIDFKDNGGAQLHATIAPGTYIMGTTSATAATLCKAIKTALELADVSATYTVTYNAGTKKVTIAIGTNTVQILWVTGTNTATSAKTILGFTADTANSASVTSDSTTAMPVYVHTFSRLQQAQLPTYSWWFDKGAKYQQFLGCMNSKLDIAIKAREFVEVDSEWVGLSYDDTGSSKTASFDAIKPFLFNQCVVNVDNSPILNYDNLKISLSNMVKADHALSGSIWPSKIYSEGFDITTTMDLFVEDATQYAKYLAGTSCALNFVLTHSDDISGAFAGTKSKLTIDIPTNMYSVASYANAPGVLKVAFTARGIYNTSSSKTVSAALVNAVSSAY